MHARQVKPMQNTDRLSFRDRDFIQTPEGFFFCVVGPYHPSDRVIAYLKYVPASRGKWRNQHTHFKRVMQAYTIPNLLETFRIVKAEHPEYLFDSEVYCITMTAVPHNRVMHHFKPEQKLAHVLRAARKDALQWKLAKFVAFLSSESGVPAGSLGVTGSILLDIHNPKFSDIDLTVYGLQNSLALKKTLAKVSARKGSPVKRFEGAVLDDWCGKKAERYPLSFDDARRIYLRKWGLGLFEDTLFSVHPVHLEEELTEKYGDKVFHPEGEVAVRAVVADASESLFLPCVYKVRDVEVLEGKREAEDVLEVVSYESLYDSLAENGEKIIAKGKLERVFDNRNGKKYYRVLVGSPEGKGEEYIRLI
jgi:predicted nucleotidyltransferase